MSFLLSCYWAPSYLFCTILRRWCFRQEAASKFRAPHQADYFGETRDVHVYGGVLEEFVILLTVSYVCSLT